MGAIKVLRGVELVRKIVGRIDHPEGMALRNEAFESALVEDVDEFLLKDHLVEFLVEGFAIISCNLLNADTLAHRIFGATGLADLCDAKIGINHHFHLFLATLMTIHSEGRCGFVGNANNGSWIAEDIAIHQQEFLASHHFSCHPERVNVVVVLVIGIVEKMERKLWAMCQQPLANHGFTIACNHDELTDTALVHGIDSALKEGAFTYLQQALRHSIGKRAKTLGHTRCQNHSDHTLLIIIDLQDGIDNGLCLLFTPQRDAQARLKTLIAHKLNLVVLHLQGFHQGILDLKGILDEDKVGH